MSNQLYNTHVKLLAFDLLSLTQTPSPSSSDPISFSRRGTPLSRAETLGTVTSRELKPHKFLKFTVDDGTGCVPCVLWLNHLSSPYFSRRNPADVRLIADLAEYQASEVKLGVLVRVRGRITAYREFLKQIQDLIWNSRMKSEERCNYKFIMQLQWQSMLKVLGKFQKCQS
ncbi:CST complex subunit STN1 isoform X1 [Vitis vinifera]|uniref:CST complex subunit STN1 isoform X1 n=1 Tax=Vitis vinifera TaxID=29760 RepID=UPI00053FA788|nr:CST complex subunit STN1 isoform X1 [Vitis vinifera]|eukprot:XP_010651993.1 PREDICTED: CST complex subunit STN1 isoform X1 [Vitis vinifera]